MNFKARQISRKSPKLPPKPKYAYESRSKFTKTHLKWILLSLAVIIIVPFSFKVLAKVIKYTGEEIIGRTIIKTVGSKLETDEDGYTNFLALGVGGYTHIAGELTDTILVASVNQKTDDIIMISIPRDLYVKHELAGNAKINTIYQTLKYNYDEETAFQGISEVVEGITGLEIHYQAKIDFQGLENVVDALGGIDINVENTIYDPYYPGPNYTYQTFSIGKGLQHLDGATALKYARSRHTTSDFDRSNRQQQIIFAIKDKAFDLNILSDKKQSEALLATIEENFSTSMDLREMLSLAEIALDLDKTNLNNLVLHDDPNSKGGFLYAPPRTEEGQAYILLPLTNSYDQIQNFIQIHKDFPATMVNPPSLDAINATNSPFLASAAKQILKRYGFTVVNTTDSTTKDLKTNILEHPLDTSDKFIQALNRVIPLEPQSLSMPSLSEFKLEQATDLPQNSINLILGEDFIDLYNLLETSTQTLPAISHKAEELIETPIENHASATEDTTNDLSLEDLAETNYTEVNNDSFKPLKN